MKAFSIEVLFAALDKLSPALAFMSQHLKKASGDAKKLDEQLKKLKENVKDDAALAGAGLSMPHTLGDFTKISDKFELAMTRYKQLNLGEPINAATEHFAKTALYRARNV